MAPSKKTPSLSTRSSAACGKQKDTSTSTFPSSSSSLRRSSAASRAPPLSPQGRNANRSSQGRQVSPSPAPSTHRGSRAASRLSTPRDLSTPAMADNAHEEENVGPFETMWGGMHEEEEEEEEEEQTDADKDNDVAVSQLNRRQRAAIGRCVESLQPEGMEDDVAVRGRGGRGGGQSREGSALPTDEDEGEDDPTSDDDDYDKDDMRERGSSVLPDTHLPYPIAQPPSGQASRDEYVPATIHQMLGLRGRAGKEILKRLRHHAKIAHSSTRTRYMLKGKNYQKVWAGKKVQVFYLAMMRQLLWTEPLRACWFALYSQAPPDSDYDPNFQPASRFENDFPLISVLQTIIKNDIRGPQGRSLDNLLPASYKFKLPQLVRRADSIKRGGRVGF